MNDQYEDRIIDIDLDEEMETERYLHYLDLTDLLANDVRRKDDTWPGY